LTAIVKINRLHDALGRFASKPGGMTTISIPRNDAAAPAPPHLLPPEGAHHVAQAELAKLPYNAAKLRQQHGVDTRWDAEWEIEHSADRMARKEIPQGPVQVAFHQHRDGGHVEAVLMPGTWNPAERTGVVKVIGRDGLGNELFTSHGTKLYKLSSMRELAVQASHHYEALRDAKELAAFDTTRRLPHAPDVPAFASVDEAHGWWKGQGYGAKLDLTGVHRAHLQEVVAGLHTAMQEHGVLMSGLRSVTSAETPYLKSNPHTWAVVEQHVDTLPDPARPGHRMVSYRGDSDMTLNPRYFARAEGLQHGLDGSERSGWHPAGTNTVFGIIRHENGHVVQNLLEQLTKDPAGAAEPYRDWIRHATTTAELMSISQYAMDTWRAKGHTREGFAEMMSAQAVHGRTWRPKDSYNKIAELPGVLDRVRENLRQLGVGDERIRGGT
jgi:hypothetical protein